MDKTEFSEWAVIELMGHNVVAGLVTDSPIGNGNLFQVNVPETDKFPAYTQFVGKGSIFRMTITDEATARDVAQKRDARPLVIQFSQEALKEKWAETILALPNGIGDHYKKVGVDAPADDFEF
jgi:hypothetical protein